jgi:hypothetical protein
VQHVDGIKRQRPDANKKYSQREEGHPCLERPQMKKIEVHQAFLSMMLSIICPNPHQEPLDYINHFIESGSKKKVK